MTAASERSALSGNTPKTMNPGADPSPAQPARTSDMAALAPGQNIFEYRIDKVLGGGGFGITYLAQDVNLELPVAIKEYFPATLAVRSADRSVHVRSEDGSSQFEWGLDRFVDEARALASFRHPNIVRVLRYFKQNGTAYIVMDYESGQPLKHWVSQQGGMNQASLLQMVYPLLDGLEAVHKLNFLHRDIKPDNIYIRADGSPVLLDFGAARRLTADNAMTNIVSPGFAPFEQYHSKGNQGPWTDLYSLGAVMYWITTGQKPAEAASRVQNDAMPKAAERGSRAEFGEQLLQAIDWALSPDEKKRPQSVAELRDALRNSEHIKTQVFNSARVVDAALMSQAMQSPTMPVNPDEILRKNVMGTIMFLDLVAYSTRSVDQQVAIKTLFNEVVNNVISGVDESTRITLDTGDGAAICFLGDPEEALLSAQLLRDLLFKKYQKKLSLRIGLHLGPLRMLKDVNNRVNVVGDGINVAQRIMDFSSANQIMVSRAYYDVISRISDGAEAMFEFLGPRQDKHKRSHDIYRLLAPEAGQQRQPGVEDNFDSTVALDDAQGVPGQEVQAIEAELTRVIGPLAHVLVKKTVRRAADAQGLRELLSVSIQDVAARETFLQGKSSSRLSGAATTRPSSFGSLSQALSRPLSRPVPSGPATGTSQPPSGTTSSSGAQHFSVEQLAVLERALSQHMGPLSRTLVRKESARHADLNELVQALALHIDKADEKARFLASASKARRL